MGIITVILCNLYLKVSFYNKCLTHIQNMHRPGTLYLVVLFTFLVLIPDLHQSIMLKDEQQDCVHTTCTNNVI